MLDFTRRRHPSNYKAVLRYTHGELKELTSRTSNADQSPKSRKGELWPISRAAGRRYLGRDRDSRSAGGKKNRSAIHVEKTQTRIKSGTKKASAINTRGGEKTKLKSADVPGTSKEL